jgi:hypothetical protein
MKFKLKKVNKVISILLLITTLLNFVAMIFQKISIKMFWIYLIPPFFYTYLIMPKIKEAIELQDNNKDKITKIKNK